MPLVAAFWIILDVPPVNMGKGYEFENSDAPAESHGSIKLNRSSEITSFGGSVQNIDYAPTPDPVKETVKDAVVLDEINLYDNSKIDEKEREAAEVHEIKPGYVYILLCISFKMKICLCSH